MGAWNSSLYGNDYACDVRDDYIFLLRTGIAPEDAAQELIIRETPEKAQADDSALFWLALADTQWNYGVLEPEIKENALRCCKLARELFQWEWDKASDQANWIKTINTLANKLQSPQPPRKKIQGFRSFICPWAMGDVFAYRLSSAYSKEMGMCGKYIAFRKISELKVYPMHINAIIHVFLNVWDKLPTLEEVRAVPLLPSFTRPEQEIINPGAYKKFRDRYYFNFTTTSKRQIPSEQITYLGNWIDEAIRPTGSISFSDSIPLGWEGSRANNTIEKTILSKLKAWSCTAP